MKMKKTVSFSEFEKELANWNELSGEVHFSHEGRKALFNHLEELEKKEGIEMEVNAMELCFDYTEYASLEEIKERYEETEIIEDLEDLRKITQVIEFDGGIIILDF